MPTSVEPILTCVTKLDNQFAAVFGYRNPSSSGVTVQLGPQNEFIPAAPQYSGQPTFFQPGVHPGVFVVNFDPNRPISWKLQGNVATAGPNAPACQLQCPPNQGRTRDGRCLDLDAPQRVLKEEDVMDVGPTFQSPAEAGAYILNQVDKFQLGRVVSRFPNGGFEIRSTFSGNTYVAHENGIIETFDDKFALLIGGRAGTITVAGTVVCFRFNSCGDPNTQPQSAPRPDATPQSVRRAATLTDPHTCQPASCCELEFCIDIDSNLHTDNIFSFTPGLARFRARTRQSSGGYRETSDWCLRFAWNPFRCTTKHGTNDLGATAVLILSSSVGVEENAQGHDTTSVYAEFTGWLCGVVSNAEVCNAVGFSGSHVGEGDSSSRTGPPTRRVRGFSGL